MSAKCIEASSNASMKPCQYIDPATLIEGTAVERVHLFHAAANGTFVAGIWECTPGAERIESYPFDEFMTVISGRVIVEQDGEAPRSFGPGQSFVMQRGWRGVWRMTEPFKKYFVYSA